MGRLTTSMNAFPDTLTPDQLAASLRATLAQHDEQEPFWVFGYGSLIWRPEFAVSEQRISLLRGYHRSLCLWSHAHRGTPAQPGLVFGLNRGGACRGVALRIAGDALAQALPRLWEREMLSGSYLPRWLRCTTPAGDIRALAFVIDRSTPRYAGELREDDLLAAVRRAHGNYGACIDYVMDTVRALRRCGIHDRRLEHIVRRLHSGAAL